MKLSAEQQADLTSRIEVLTSLFAVRVEHGDPDAKPAGECKFLKTLGDRYFVTPGLVGVMDDFGLLGERESRSCGEPCAISCVKPCASACQNFTSRG
jgi:hypothetical protein